MTVFILAVRGELFSALPGFKGVNPLRPSVAVRQFVGAVSECKQDDDIDQVMRKDHGG